MQSVGSRRELFADAKHLLIAAVVAASPAAAKAKEEVLLHLTHHPPCLQPDACAAGVCGHCILIELWRPSCHDWTPGMTRTQKGAHTFSAGLHNCIVENFFLRLEPQSRRV